MLQGAAFEQLLDLAQVALYAAVELPVGQLQTNAAEKRGVRLDRQLHVLFALCLQLSRSRFVCASVMGTALTARTLMMLWSRL